MSPLSPGPPVATPSSLPHPKQQEQHTMTTSIFDGKTIDVHAVRFNGILDIDQAKGSEVKQDDVITFVVTGTVKKSTLDTTKEAQLRRTNTISVLQANMLTRDEVEQVQVALAMGDGDLSSLFKDIELPPSEPSTDQGSSDPDDGPIEPDWNC